MTPFRDQKSEILRERGTTQSDSGIEEGPLLTQHTRISRFDCLWQSTPSCFWTIRALVYLQYMDILPLINNPSL